MGRGRRAIKNTCEESRVERPISRREKKKSGYKYPVQARTRK
jgi:hypothetical protein